MDVEIMKKCPICEKENYTIWILDEWSMCTHCAVKDGNKDAGSSDMK